MTELRIISSSDLGATVVPLSASFGEFGTCAGIERMLEASEIPSVWFDLGDLVDEAADPANRATDGIWWNWCRMPAGVSGHAALLEAAG